MQGSPPHNQLRTDQLGLLAAFLLLCLSVGWFGLGGHPLYSRSDARYADLSMNMAASPTLEGWLVPTLSGHPYPTKPPLTYWLEAGCLRLVGHSALAVCIPGAAAGSLTLLLVFLLVWHIHGLRRAVLATGILAVMPLFAYVNRLPLTDALLDLFWFGTLAAGLMAVRQPGRPRWPLLMWVSVALGLMTKGPVAWLPVGLLLLWLAVGRRWREARALRLPVGMPLSLIPLAAWAVALALLEPTAIAVWWHELGDRVTGHPSPHLHLYPWWFFIPIFLGGLFPATVVMMLPWLNYPWEAAREALRRGDEVCLWALSVAVPFVVFSAIPGKLPTYLLPLCAPLAIITGGVLERCIDDRSEDRSLEIDREVEAGTGPPSGGGATSGGGGGGGGDPFFARLPRAGDVFCIAAVAAGTIGVVLMMAPVAWLIDREHAVAATGPAAAAMSTFPASGIDYLRHAFIFVFPAAIFLLLSGIWLRLNWQFRPERRFTALAVVWVATVLACLSAFAGESRLTTPHNNAELIAEIRAKTGLARPKLVTVGVTDLSLTFYNRRPSPRADYPTQIRRWLELYPNEVVLVAEAAAWDKVERADPAFAARFQTVMTWPEWWRDRPRLVLRPVGAETMPATQKSDEGRDEIDEE